MVRVPDEKSDSNRDASSGIDDNFTFSRRQYLSTSIAAAGLPLVLVGQQLQQSSTEFSGIGSSTRLTTWEWIQQETSLLITR